MWINTQEKLKNFLLELLFPSFCLGCNLEGTLLCQDCKHVLEISEYNYCLCNKNPLRLSPDVKNGKCYRCQDKKLAGLYSALPYHEKFLTRKIIYQFKYKPFIKSLAPFLAEIITEHLELAGNTAPEVWANSVLIAVPLDKSKMKERGYNQSQELAKELSKILGIPNIENVLVKVRLTQPQMKLKKEQREQNLQDAFAINPVRGFASNGAGNPSAFAGKKVFLIDDVYTTGSTMEACAMVLKSGGAKSVWGIAIAREG